MSAASREQLTTVTLRALEGRPLDEHPIRDMVEAMARGIAERQGIDVLDVRSEGDRISVTLRAPRMVAVGFAAELRRLTNRWYTEKFAADTLWGNPPPPAPDGEEEQWDEPWKTA
jgi:hypothetical protein